MIKRLIERPIAVTMSVIAIVVLGLISFRYLPISLMPNIDIPKITIHVSAPGLSVREVNGMLLSQIKNHLSQVVGLSSISTEARSDAGVVYIDFEPDSDIDIAFIEVNEKVDRAVRYFPEGIERPKIVKASVTDIPAFYLNISLKEKGPQNEDLLSESGIRFTELGSFVRNVISKRIEQLPQTAMADVSGVITPELFCIPDYKKLTSMGVGVELLENAIKRNNISLGALSIRDGEYRYNINFDAQITSKEDIESIYINHKGRIFRFSELCKIIERPAQRSGLVRSGRNNALSIAIIKQVDSKMEDLQSSIDKLISDFEKEYPHIEFELTRDQTQLLSYSINNLKNNLIYGGVLASLVIFLFMGDFRSPLLIIGTIPLSLIITLLTFHLLGITINIISLSGLILGVGMMVDNSIIVIDNIIQKWDSGMPLKDAISRAIKEIFTPMLSSILTTCSVFLPLIFLSGVVGAMFYDQAMAVTITLFSSLLVSTLVLPVYFYVMYRKRDATSSRHNMFNTKINFYRPYEVSLKWSLRHGKLLLFSFILLIPATYFVYQYVEKSRLPVISYDDTIMIVDWNSGISLEENDKRIWELLSLVKDKSVQTTSMVGSQQFMMAHTPNITASEAVVYIKTESAEVLKDVQKTLSDYISERYPTGVISFNVSGNIFDMIFAESESDLVVQLRNKNGGAPSVMDIVRVVNRIRDTLPNLYIPSAVLDQNIQYIADVEAMAMYSLSYDDIYQKMKSIVGQNQLFRINQGGYSIPVITGDAMAEVNDILSSSVRNSLGVEIPLSFVVRETKGEDFKLIYSGSGGDFYPLNIDANDRDLDEIISTIEELVSSDDSLFVTFTGDYFSSREMVMELILILIVAVALLYFILAAQFESIVQPIIILLEIVVDIFFVLFGLWILNESLNLMSLIGIVVMSGIIINDSILKVDTINRLRKEGMPLLKAIYIGGHRRLKPIIMTSLTTILAIAPFLSRVDMGSDLQYPLSLTIIIGMIFGTLVSLFFIPVVYHAIYKNRE